MARAPARHGRGRPPRAAEKDPSGLPVRRSEISFLDGDRALQARVAEAAKLWTAPGLANLRFVFRQDTNNTPVRISFRQSGSWSVLGKGCLTITDLAQPTMNFGWLHSGSSDDEVRSVVLHEFGHALGLIHEHQVPEGGIKWNKAKVYEDLSGPPNNWEPDVIDRNMFEPFSAGDTNFTRMDPHSIMMYPFPAKWTLDGFSTGINQQLSAADKQFIHAQYP